jgi:predicted N-acyltransferase
MQTSALRARRLTGIADVSVADWNRLGGTDNPFLRHEYLHALEASGSATTATGWTPMHVVVEDGERRLVGGMPLWLKRHSFGELVYDFAWAQAYERAGFRYYPKLVACVPFSPIAGPRLLVAPDAPRIRVTEMLLTAARELAEETRCSSLHWLFTDTADTAMLEALGYLHRTGYQFHWHNNGYSDFDAFLSGFTAQKRKKLKRERRYVHEAGVHTEIRAGEQMTPELWDTFYTLYTHNIQRHGGMIHLTREFFQILGRSLPEAVVMVLARNGNDIVGAAINLRDHDALYGRYWGGLEGFHSLHFETCYYAPIEYCIAQGLGRFEGGAGGEHKLARGFLPVATHSLHWLRHPQFARAVADFLERERNGVEYYMDELNEHAPFKRSVLHEPEPAGDNDHPAT